MRALLYTAPHRSIWTEQPTPVPGAGEVLVAVRAVGICGSDMHAWHGHDDRRPPPLVLGHEAAGLVASGPRTGERVAINPLVVDPDCPVARAGRPHLSPTRAIISMPPRPGAFAEYVTIPERNLLPVPEGLSLRDAALTEPVAVSWHAVRIGLERLAAPAAEARVLVQGGGAIGLGAALVARHFGAAGVRVAEPHAGPARRWPRSRGSRPSTPCARSRPGCLRPDHRRGRRGGDAARCLAAGAAGRRDRACGPSAGTGRLRHPPDHAAGDHRDRVLLLHARGFRRRARRACPRAGSDRGSAGSRRGRCRRARRPSPISTPGRVDAAKIVLEDRRIGRDLRRLRGARHRRRHSAERQDRAQHALHGDGGDDPVDHRDGGLSAAVRRSWGSATLQQGFLIGATIHDVAQVVGAGFSVSDEAGELATIVKLFRVAMLPVVLIAIVLVLRATGTAGPGNRMALLPWFMVLFVASWCAAASSRSRPSSSPRSRLVSRACLVTAIAALGIKTSLRALSVGGGRASRGGPAVVVRRSRRWSSSSAEPGVDLAARRLRAALEPVAHRRQLLEPCMDGPLARALFGSGVLVGRGHVYGVSSAAWSAARPDEVRWMERSRSMARGLRRTGPNWVSFPSCFRRYAITSRRASPFRCCRTGRAAISFFLSPAWLGSCRRGR
jgi:hypothetical protein